MLAARKSVNAGDLARSVLLTVPAPLIDEIPDPGEPGKADREVVVLKSGASEGKPWRRKPRLQVRLQGEHSIPKIRRLLALALALDDGSYTLAIDPEDRPVPTEPDPQSLQQIKALQDDVDRLRAVVSVLSFDPLRDGVVSSQDARYIMGLDPQTRLTANAVRRRFRLLATIYHPDSPYGDNARMSQLNQAVSVLLGRS